MRVALNTQTAQNQKTGIGWYVVNLLENLPKVAPDITYVPIEPAPRPGDLNTPKRFLWDQVGFPSQLTGKQVDLVHTPSFSAPLAYFGPKVVTIHDLITLRFPENLSLPSRLFFGSFMPYTYRSGDHFLTISEHSKRDIIELLGIDPEKITVTYLAASDAYRPMQSQAEKEETARVLKKYKVPSPYLLSVCTLEPRKNLPFLVRAFAAATKLNQETKDTYLVLVGKKGWQFEELFKTVTELGLADRIHVTGYAADEDLPHLYSGATGFLFPSLYEGFGLPPLEAMRCGCPVISSDASALPEVMGKAGILADPTDEAAWAKAIAELCKNEGLRTKLRAASLEQGKVFSWEDTTRRTADVYRTVLAKHRTR